MREGETRKKILLVEDEADIRELYSEVLRDEGYEVMEAANGDTGLVLILQNDWDLLLLDIMLPGKDGVQILKQMSDKHIGARKPIILLTNLGSEHVINVCFDLGADGYLIKSEITPDKVVAEVKEFLGK